MPVKRMKEFLDSHGVEYRIIPHTIAYTAQETAASAHISGKEVAKTVMVKLDGKMAMAVLPASENVDFDLLRNASGAREARLAGEQEFRHLFPECELGAMPPFGNLYGMDVYVAEKLTEDEEIAFNAGTHTELVRLVYEDFTRLVKPKVMAFSAHR